MIERIIEYSIRNRVLVLLSWFWNWLLNARDARLITGDTQITVQKPLFGESGPGDPVKPPGIEKHSKD